GRMCIVGSDLPLQENDADCKFSVTTGGSSEALSLPRCRGERPLRSIPLHGADAGALSGNQTAGQAGPRSLPLDRAPTVLGGATRIPGEVAGLRAQESGASGHTVLLETVHRLEPTSALAEFGRKAVVAQVIVEAHRPGAAVAALLLAVIVPVFETELVEEERPSVHRRIGPDPLVDHRFKRSIAAGILALGAAPRELPPLVSI